jgi:hypothetical protein
MKKNGRCMKCDKKEKIKTLLKNRDFMDVKDKMKTSEEERMLGRYAKE